MRVLLTTYAIVVVVTIYVVMDAGDVAVPSCDSCRNERAVVHCAQHGGARLCLVCDLAAHHAARAHQRAPLCDACHAAPAVARSDHHTEAFCASCARDASPSRHCHRPAAAYTGIPGPAEMARIFSIDVPPPPPPPADEPWITDTVLPFAPYDNSHIHMNYTNYYYPEMFEDANPDISKEMTTIGEEDLLVDNANQQDYFQAWTNSFDSVALMEPGALQEPSYLDLDPSYLDLGSYLGPDHQQMASSSCSDIAMLSDTSFLQPLNMSNASYVPLPMMDANINNEIGAASSSSDLAQFIPQSSDHSLMQPLNINDETAYDQLPVMDTNTSNNNNNNTSSEFPCVNFQSSNTGSLLGGSSSMFDGQDQQASHVLLPEKSCPDPEKRQRAVQRYKEKKNNRRFVKQIMYASRKATADTRRRVRGRFVKASLEQGTSSNDNKQPKHEGN